MKMMKLGRHVAAALLVALLAVPAWAGSVDINKADAATIAKELKGIGPAKAKAIVDYRTKNGPFKSVDELKNVKGIGDELLNKIRGSVQVNGSESSRKTG